MTKYSKTVTLDWDGISLKSARLQFHKFCDEEKPVRAILLESATKGWHVKAEFVQEVDNWRMRRKWKDDPFRLLYEILRIGHRVDEEFFWTGKVLNYGTDSNPKLICFEEIQLESYSQGKFESFG